MGQSNAAKKPPAKKAGGRTTPAGTRPPAKQADPLTRLKNRKGITRKLPIYLDSEVQEEFEAAKAAWDDLVSNDIVRQRTPEDERERIAARLKTAAEAMAENTIYLHLRRPEVEMVHDDGTKQTLRGRAAYEHLLKVHPPTDEDTALIKQLHGDEAEAPYGALTFMPALISACCEDPVMTPADVDDLTSEWTQTETLTVFGTCMEICNGSQIATLGKG